MILEKINDNITWYWANEPEFELQKSLVFGTVSRSLKSAKERLDFYKEKGLTQNANRFHEENLGFGDRSIAEQYNLNFELNNVPISFTTEFLSFPFMSPIESSTRYLKIGKDDYYKFEALSYDHNYDDFISQVELGLEMYLKAYEPLLKYYKEKFPFEGFEWGDLEDGKARKSWTRAIEVKAIDAIKIFLPMATKTNATICMNARGLQDAVAKLEALNFKYNWALNPIMNAFKRYLREHNTLKSLFKHLGNQIRNELEHVHNNMPFLERKIPSDECIGQVCMTKMNNIYGDPPEYKFKRFDRFHRLPEMYKHFWYEMSITSSLAAFRDLQRHRQVVKTYHQTFDVIMQNEDMRTYFPSFVDEYLSASQTDKLANHKCFRENASPLGLAIKWSMTGNLYELSNIIELRTGRGGYWEYIEICRNMALCIGGNFFEHADILTDYNETLPYLRQELRKDLSNQ